jgi:hypothetical protein
VWAGDLSRRSRLQHLAHLKHRGRSSVTFKLRVPQHSDLVAILVQLTQAFHGHRHIRFVAQESWFNVGVNKMHEVRKVRNRPNPPLNMRWKAAEVSQFASPLPTSLRCVDHGQLVIAPRNVVAAKLEQQIHL